MFSSSLYDDSLHFFSQAYFHFDTNDVINKTLAMSSIDVYSFIFSLSDVFFPIRTLFILKQMQHKLFAF